MMNVLAHPRIRELLEQAWDAERLRATLKAKGEPVDEVSAALGTIHRDLGRELCALAHDPTESTERADDPAHIALDDGSTPLPEYDDESWYTEEITIDRSRPLFEPGDLTDHDDHTEIPEPDPLPTDDATLGETPDPPFRVEPLARFLFRLDDPDDPVVQYRRAENRPTWATDLDELLRLLEVSSGSREQPRAEGSHEQPRAGALHEEASRVQWGAGELDERVDGLPEPVQLCLLGLLSARAQLLRSQLQDDLEGRRALDRLQRYRLKAELPMVAGLAPHPKPEYGSWENDARQWWALLTSKDDPRSG